MYVELLLLSTLGIYNYVYKNVYVRGYSDELGRYRSVTGYARVAKQPRLVTY